MSNEITVSVSAQLSNLGLTDIFQPGNIQVTQTNQELFRRVIALTAGSDTSLTALISGITTLGIAYLYNLDPTNYIQWGPDSGGALVPVGRLLPRSTSTPDIPAVLRLEPGITLRAKAHTGNCNLLLAVYGN
jgi:hypothetical protein